MILHFLTVLLRNWVNGLLGFLPCAQPNSSSNLTQRERGEEEIAKEKEG
jgi:hypothetical protein